MRTFPSDWRAEMLLEENEDGNSAHQSAQIVCLMSDVLFCFLFFLNKETEPGWVDG